MSLAVESLKEIGRHVENEQKFKTMLLELVDDLIAKKLSGQEIELRDLFNIMPSNVDTLVKKYNSIL